MGDSAKSVGSVRLAALLATFMLYQGCGARPGDQAAVVDKAIPGNVTDERIKAHADEPGAWLAHGRTYSEQRFSPLTYINRDTVRELGLAWYLDLGTRRTQEATPIVVDGVMYFTSVWSRVYAVDAASGEVLWQFQANVGAWRGSPMAYEFDGQQYIAVAIGDTITAFALPAGR